MSIGTDRSAEASRLKGEVSIVRIISETLALMRDGRLYVALCPFHREKTPSFTVYSDHYHCFGCGAHGDVFAWLMRAHRMTFHEAVAHLGGQAARKPLAALALPPAPDDASDQAERVELARCIWCESIDPAGTPVEAYLRHRGAVLPDEPVIRFHTRCPRKDGPLPAMVALMAMPETGEPCGVHRTFLLSDGSGKAAVSKPKMMLGAAGVIRLAEQLTNGLGLAEGIETALSVTQRIGWGPVWAAGSNTMISKFPVLACTTLNIFADADDSGPGLKSAQECAARWIAAGAEALIHVPPAGADWNDAARRLAA